MYLTDTVSALSEIPVLLSKQNLVRLTSKLAGPQLRNIYVTKRNQFQLHQLWGTEFAQCALLTHGAIWQCGAKVSPNILDYLIDYK